MHTREIVFEPYDAQHQRDSGTEPVLLRAKKELLEHDPKWHV
jgi:mediator of RNA polymerase II transcription subunit 18